MASPGAILEVRSLVKRYGTLTAVAGVSFTVTPNQCFGLLGPNGAGKTTTIEIIEGIIAPTSGQLLYRGAPIDRHFRAEIGIQFQSTALQDFLTVRETLEMFHRLYGGRSDLSRVVDECALSELLDKDARKLSGGQRQRLLLAIALVNDPRVLFLDEPTTGLDPQARRNFWELIGKVKERGTTILLTTHYMEEAHVLCDEIAIMDHGRIIAHGAPDALLKGHFDDVVVQLPIDDFPESLRHLPHSTVANRGVIEINSTDVNATLKMLTEANARLTHLQVRPRDLEDLFLDLTGKALRA